MAGTIATLWRTNRLLVIAFTVALALTLFFAVRTVMFYAYWSQHRDQPIEPWMTLGYIGHSWNVPPETLGQSIGLEPEKPDRRPIGRIAHDLGVNLGDLEASILQAIDTERRLHPELAPPPPPAPDTPAPKP